MTTKRKTQLKRAALSWLCVAAIAGGSVPAGLPGIIPAVTAAAEDVIAADHIIDLSDEIRTNEYITITDEGSYTKLTINVDGTYKLTGSNTTDVKIYAANGVTADIVCDNAYIKNTKGSYEFRTEQIDDIAGRYYLEARNYICPFCTDTTGKITLSGKLVVDTYTVDLEYHYQSTPFADGDSHITADCTIVDYTINRYTED